MLSYELGSDEVKQNDYVDDLLHNQQITTTTWWEDMHNDILCHS